MRKLTALLLAGLLLLTFTGCGKNGLVPQSITLQLNGFPYNYDSYDILVSAQKDAKVLEVYKYKNISKSFTATIKVPSGANFLVVYLVNDGVRRFFWVFECKSVCATSYWLDYQEYMEKGIRVYGISEDLARNAFLGMSEVMDFQAAPYYLYKLTDVSGKTISVSATTGKFDTHALELRTGNALDNLEWDSTYDTIVKHFSAYPDDVLYCLFQYDRPIKVTMAINEGPESIALDSYCRSAVAGESPDRIYLITEQTLYYINPLTRTIDQTITYPDTTDTNTHFRHIGYSTTDQKVYIATDYSYSAQGSKLLIWNVATSEWSSVDLPGLSSIKDLAVAPELRKIILLESPAKIVDMDTLEAVIVSLEPSIGFIGVDEGKRKLYVGASTTDYLLSRYSLEGSSVTLDLQKNTGGASPRNIALSPDKSKILISSTGYLNSKLYVYNTSDFSPLGEWSFNFMLTWAIFSPDGKHVYATFSPYGEDLIYVLDTQDYTISKQLPFPGGGARCSQLLCNSDGSVLIASRSEPAPEDHRVFFYPYMNAEVFANGAIKVYDYTPAVLSNMPRVLGLGK